MNLLLKARLCLAALGYLVICNTAWAASFNCANATTYSENAICSNEAFSRLDEKISSLFTQSMELTDEKAALRQDQRDWLASRNTCATAACVGEQLRERVEFLQDYRAGLTPAPSVMAPVPAPAPVIAAPAPVITPPAVHAPTVAPQATHPAAPAPSAAAPVQAPRKDPSLLPAKLAGLAMLIVVLASIWLHHRGTLTIYADYTDATWTSVTPMLGIVSYWVFRFFEIPHPYALIAAGILFSLMMVQVVRQTYKSNGVSVYFLMALMAKMIMIGAYLIVMIVLIIGKSRTQREARNKRRAIAAITSLFVLLSGWLCRDRRFTPLGVYLEGQTTP
ncbi:hypothetical protein [Pseudomonas purpurea]|uniref:lysozyme inhibitor LprI family protein n=1 Tax=Pseudomonas purpurea TaxID=3136737 RepID=UPI003263DE8D